tara:strand:+ start:41 stop:259 length:219 start_codon:yes stop_codon:yes gene_type:complete
MPKKLIPGSKRTPVYKKSSGFKMKNPIKFMGHMGAIMGTGSSGIPTMGMPNQNIGGSPRGLKPRTNRKVRVR